MTEILVPVLIILIGLSLLKCPIYISVFCSAIYLQLAVNHMSLTSLFTGFFEAMTKNSLLPFRRFQIRDSLVSLFIVLLFMVPLSVVPALLSCLSFSVFSITFLPPPFLSRPLPD